MNLETPLTDGFVLLKGLDKSVVSQVYLSWMQDPEIICYLESRFVRHTEDSLLAFIRAMQMSPTALLTGIYLEERHVGNIKLEVNMAHARGEIGILIGDKKSWGKGVGRRAIMLIADYAFGSLGIAKLSAGCYENNIGSIKALKGAGFEIEAVRRQHFIEEDRRVGGVYLARFALAA